MDLFLKLFDLSCIPESMPSNEKKLIFLHEQAALFVLTVFNNMQYKIHLGNKTACTVFVFTERLFLCFFCYLTGTTPLSLACNVLYINSVEMESLTGPQAIAKAISETLAATSPPTATVVHFKVSSQGITLTDNQRK